MHPLNHVITYLPSFNLYVDSTAELAPFGSLPDTILDKPTVLTATGTIGHTPKMKAEDHTVKSEISMAMREDGSVSGESISHMTGSLEIDSRGSRYNDQQTGQEIVVRNLFFRFNEIGDGKLSYTDPTNFDEVYKVQASFEMERIVDTSRAGAFRLPVGLAPGRIAGYTTYKPIAARRFPYVCDSHTDVDKTRFTLPSNLQITQLPEDVLFDDGELRFTSHYRQDQQQVLVERRLVVQYPSRVCTPDQHANWKELIAVMRADQQAMVMFRVTGK